MSNDFTSDEDDSEDFNVLFPKIPSKNYNPEKTVHNNYDSNSEGIFNNPSTNSKNADFKLPSVRSEGFAHKKPLSASSRGTRRSSNNAETSANNFASSSKPNTTRHSQIKIPTFSTISSATNDNHTQNSPKNGINSDYSSYGLESNTNIQKPQTHQHNPRPFFVVPSFEDENVLARREKKKEEKAQKERIKTSMIECFTKKQREFIKEDLVLEREHKRTEKELYKQQRIKQAISSTKNSPFLIDVQQDFKRVAYVNSIREKELKKEKKRFEKKIEKVRENLVLQTLNQFPDPEELKRKYIKFLVDVQKRKQGLADLQKGERNKNNPNNLNNFNLNDL